MSKLSDPPVAGLAMGLKPRFDLDVLIETGTYEGDFDLMGGGTVFEGLYHRGQLGLSGPGPRTLRQSFQRGVSFGGYAVCLPFVASILMGPSMFWLDAHAAPGMFGSADDWPIIDELGIIERSEHHHVILIDDAHCFLPGTPHPACPPLEAVEKWALASGYDCAVRGDVIVLTPAV